MGKSIITLVRKVKKMEKVMKEKGVAFDDQEGEDENSSKQGRNLDEEQIFKSPAQDKPTYI